MKGAGLFAVLWLVAASAMGDERGWQPDAVFSQVGAGRATGSLSVGGGWRWKHAWMVRDSLVLSGRWDITVGRWRADLDGEKDDQHWVTQVSVVPTLRLSGLSDRGFYGEIGSGPVMLMPIFQNRDRYFSTEFNFQSHLALGYVLGRRAEHDIGLRIEHFSNGGIREPNPGMEIASLRYTYRF